MADKPKKSDKRVFKESERKKLEKFRQTHGAFDPETGKPPVLGKTAFGKAAFKRAKKGKTSKPAASKPKKK